MKTIIIAIIFTTLGLTGCKDKQEIAQEKSNDVLRQMYKDPPQHRTYQQIQEDNKKRRNQK